MKTGFSFLALIVSVILFFYSALGVLQALDLGAGPDYSKDRLITNLGAWGGLAIACLGLSVYFGLRIYGARRADKL